MKKSKTKVMVTGASGFVGGHICFDLAKSGHDVVAIEGTRNCARQVCDAAKGVRRGDLADMSFVTVLLQEVRPDVIVHAAALANTGICQKKPELAKLHNVIATQNIVDVCSDVFATTAPLLIYLSTDLVFDGIEAPSGGFSEEHVPEPRSVYGKSKYEAEGRVRKYSGSAVIARTCLVYGGKLGENEGFMGWLRGDLASGRSVTLFEDEWRTPIYVSDISSAMEAIIRNRDNESSCDAVDIVNVAGPERISRYEFGLRVAEHFGFDSELVLKCKQADVPTEAPRARDVSLGSRKLESRYGIASRFCEEALCLMGQSDSDKE